MTTGADGKNYKTKFYNLDVIISIWLSCQIPAWCSVSHMGNEHPKGIHQKGFAMDDDRLKELGGGGYFKSCWKESVTSGLLKRYSIVRYWKSMRPAWITILMQNLHTIFQAGTEQDPLCRFQ